MSYGNKRPISPHLQIYNIFSKELGSGLSILNRVTGIGLAVGLLYITMGLAMAAMGEKYYNMYLSFITSWFGYLSLFGITACYFYHLFNGTRYLVFALGYWINKKSVFISGFFVLLLTATALISSCIFVYFNYFY